MSTRRWLGGALAVAQVETLTIADTWAANDTATLTINGRDIVVTIGTTATTTQIATEIAAVLSSASTSLGTGYSATERGPNVAEFREFTAVASGSTVVLTGATKGKPFTITVAESTAGDGTIGTSTTTSATGPNFYNNADNWSGATAPVDGDTVLFDSGNVDVLYGLANSSVTPAAVIITQGYTGRIGLPIVNKDSSQYPYPEYRQRYAQIGDADDSTNLAVTIGGGEGAGSRRLLLDFGDGQVTVDVLDTGRPETDGEPALTIKGTHTSNVVNISKGNVAIAPLADETSAVATLRVGYRNNVAGDSIVTCGSGVTLTTVNQSGGRLTVASNVTTYNVTAGELIHLAGTVTTLNLDGGACRYRSSGTMTTANVGKGGNLDFTQDMRAKTVTNLNLYEGAEYHDPFGVVTQTNGADFVRCSVADVVYDIVPHRTLTMSSI